MVNVHWLADTIANPPAWLLPARSRHLPVLIREAEQEADLEAETRDREFTTRKVIEAVRVASRSTDRALETARIHVGPTNSGKTCGMLNALAAHGAGVYAGPLRMLAWEAYQKLVVLVGEDNVGLITGEEKINPTAPILCCTAESAPQKGVFLALDEAHWAADADRGTAWTELLLGDFAHIHVTAATEAADVLRSALADAWDLEVVTHTRLSSLTVAKAARAETMPKRSVVVAFSAKAVRGIARELREAGHQVGVLYGALPPEVRREQIRLLEEGILDTIVATDVIGHGVNLPIDHVWFAEGTKFDGVSRRPLHSWEAGQIAGRAGRGMGNTGTVGSYIPKMPGFHSPLDAVKRGAAVALGTTKSDLRIDTIQIAPVLAALGVNDPAHLAVALTRWETLAEELHRAHPLLRPRQVGPWVDRLAAIGHTLRLDAWDVLTEWPITVEEVWSLIQLPVDAESLIFDRAVRSLVNPTYQFANLIGETPRTLLAMDEYSRMLRDALTVVNLYGEGFGGLCKAVLAEKEVAAASATIRLIAAENAKKDLLHGEGLCRNCGSPCPPWFTICEDCHDSRRR